MMCQKFKPSRLGSGNENELADQIAPVKNDSWDRDGFWLMSSSGLWGLHILSLQALPLVFDDMELAYDTRIY